MCNIKQSCSFFEERFLKFLNNLPISMAIASPIMQVAPLPQQTLNTCLGDIFVKYLRISKKVSEEKIV